MYYNLVSYYYLSSKTEEYYNVIANKSKLIMVDSGAHSFQKGKVVEWEKYTRNYAEWIKKHDNKKILGYFEMDVDNIIGYKKVLYLHKILDSVSDKIIPVWHKNRGIKNYINMCKAYSGKIIAITGFKNEDIKDEQYSKFLNIAWDNGCRLHCLGMTRKKILDSVPFDFTDSASWIAPDTFGKVINGKKVKLGAEKEDRKNLYVYLYKEAMKMQKKYNIKWKNYEESYKRGL